MKRPMMYPSRRKALAGVITIALVGLAGCRRPPDVPTRPERLARIELQIANTPTQSDDYVPTGTIVPARIRVLNGGELDSAVRVTLKNLDYQAAPPLLFAATGTPAASSLDLDLPIDGSWLPLVLAPVSAQLRARDKDAVIEILERRPDGIVLGRKSLMAGSASPVSATTPQIEVRVGDPETADDYLTWRPIRAGVRLAAPAVADVAVTLRNMMPVTAGRLVFGAAPPLDSTVVVPTMAASLDVMLPASGEWVAFYVAGDFGHPSNDDKDAVLEIARTADGALMGREGLMVRIRKNANALTANERDRYLYAAARLNLGLGNHVTYQHIHAVAGYPTYPGHGGPVFLAWHRPYILRYERELQAIDPAVALHYWRFDQAAPSVFASNFMGGPPVAGNASFDPANPLSAWTIEGLGGLPRAPRFTPAQSPTDFGLLDETGSFALGGGGATYAAFSAMENNPHGWSHSFAGYVGGWIGSVPTAVRDPLFFLLHSNVERLWAKWQWLYARQDPLAAASYSPQGAYPGTGSVRLGHYVEDRMWPWDERTGFVVPGDALTERPATAPGGSLPSAIGGWGPPARPRPLDVIDYDRWTLLGSTGLAYGYDDVPFVF